MYSDRTTGGLPGSSEVLPGDGLPPNPAGLNLAASWYIALPSRRLRGKPLALELFGRPLVAWRDGRGCPVIMPRFCPHMGASLALGTVIDGCLRCPFHHWRFDASGRCVHIPGTTKIPAAARRSSYPVVERYGYVWVWYGSAEPQYDLPGFPALEARRGEYAGFRYWDDTTGTVRLLLENAIDYFHFLTLHGLAMSPVRFEQLYDQAQARDNGPRIGDDAWFGALIEGTMTSFSPWAHPVGWLVSQVTTFFTGSQFRLLVDGWPGGQRFTFYAGGQEIYKVLMGTTPTADRRTAQAGWALVRKTGRPWRTLFYLMLFYAQHRGGTAQDIPIYNTTATGKTSSYVRYDRGLIRFRRYYQGWVDRAEQGGAP